MRRRTENHGTDPDSPVQRSSWPADLPCRSLGLLLVGSQKGLPPGTACIATRHLDIFPDVWEKMSEQEIARTDPSAWVNLHGDALYRFALIRVRDQAVAEDLVQETFLAAIRSKETFAGQATERTWMTGILKNKIVDHFRQQSRSLPPDESNEKAEFVTAFFDSHGHWKSRVRAWSADACESISNQDFWRVLDECMGKLPGGVSGAFTLRDVEGLGTGQICKILDITATNLGARLHRARMWLRKCLEQNWFMHEKRKGVG